MRSDRLFCLNVQDTKYHYVRKILTGEKPVETRTIESIKRMINTDMLHEGDRIGIVYKSKLWGTVTARALVFYNDEEEFEYDQKRHLVPKGSKYWYDSRKGKVGIELSDPVMLDTPIPVGKMTHASGFRII